MKERTQRILTKLLTTNTYIRLEELNKEFNISERTTRYEITEINNYLKEKDFPITKSVRSKGLILNVPPTIKEKLLFLIQEGNSLEFYSPEERFLNLLFDISDTSTRTLLYEKEEFFQVSKSTLDEDMRKLRSFLKSYGINVVSLTKQGITFQGDERSIRTMLYDVINNFTNLERLINCTNLESVVTLSDKIVLNFIPLDLLQLIDQIYDEVVQKTRVDINQAYRNQVILFIYIWIFRLQNGCTVNELTKVKSYIKEGSFKTLIDNVCDHLQLSPSLNELKYITFILESFNPKDMSNSFDWVTAQLLAIQLIDHVEKETGIPFSREEEDLYEGLYKHITGLLSRVRNDLQVYNPMKSTIKDSYKEIYQAVNNFKLEIENYTKKELSEDEIGFLSIYFSTSESKMKQDKQYVYQAVVICNHGISTGKLLAANLTEQFNIEIIAVLSSHELDFIKKLDIDLIFTTITINYPQKPVLILNPILKENDKKEIKSFLKKHKNERRVIKSEVDSTILLQSILKIIVASGGDVTTAVYKEVESTFNEHHLTINKREIQPMLQDTLKDSDILLQEECNDWKETIIKVAQPLLKNKVIEKTYIEAMIQSVEEYGPYIVIGKHLALAHARPEDGVNELGISVMTLANPVNFGNPDNDPVKIIFCLAAVDSYSHLNVMKNLVELINDEEKVEELIKVKDIASFNSLLYGTNIK